MKFHLGPDINKPTIAANVTLEDCTELQSMTGFAESFDVLKERKHISLSEADEGMELKLLLRKIGRTSTSKHEELLKPVIEVIDCLSICRSAEDDDTFSIVGLSSEHDDSGRLPLSIRVRWPDSDEKIVEQQACATMKGLADQMRYEPELRLGKRVSERYDGLIWASIDREGVKSKYRGVTLQTNPEQSASIDTPSHIYDPNEPTFEVQAHNLYSHKQQLICMGGALAIARAEELVDQ